MNIFSSHCRPNPSRLFSRLIVYTAFLWVLLSTTATAQIDPRSLLIGGGLGTGFYHGEFNSLQDDFAPVPGFSGGLQLQYNLSSSFALNGGLGLASLPYTITSFVRAKYASNFFGPADGTTYPGSTIPITDGNSISLTSLHLIGKYYLADILPEDYSLYFLGGLGYVDFTPQNGNGQQLPTDLTGAYSTNSFMLPLGGGVEYKLSDKIRLWGELVYHRTFTDYLDGYAHYLDFDDGLITTGPGTQATQSDHFTTLQVGISYKIYERKPEPEPSERPSPLASNQQPSSGSPSPSESPDSTPESPAPTTDQPEPLETESPSGERSNDAFKLDPNAADSDNDKISDYDEINRYGTNPYSQDSDNDGLTDGEEIALYNTDPLAADTDGDLLSDLAEVRRHGTSPRRADTDQDMLSDNEELARTGTDPLQPDTDRDGIIDGIDDCATLPGPPENNGCPPDRVPTNDAVTPGLTAPYTGVDLDPLEPGARQEFSNIFFRRNSDDFDFTRPETAESLVQLRDYLQNCEEVGTLIEGHTSSEGDPLWNLELSQMRADRVKEWLIANGVAQDKILGTVGYGSRMPKLSEPLPGTLSPESVERVRAQNRRITTVFRNPCEN